MDTEKILKEAHSNGYDLGRKERTKQILELEIPENKIIKVKGLDLHCFRMSIRMFKKEIEEKCV